MRVIFTIVVLVIIILVCIVCNPSMKKKFHDWRHENDPEPEEDTYSSMDVENISLENKTTIKLRQCVLLIYSYLVFREDLYDNGTRTVYIF